MENFNLLSYKDTAKQMNNIAYTNYYYRISLLARSRFKWNNLPQNMNEKWIEQFLYSNGSCVFFKDPILGYMVTRYTDNGQLNQYDEPTFIRPYATNYVYDSNPEMPIKLQIGDKPPEANLLENNINCVIIRNNDDMIPDYPIVRMYAYDLMNIKRTIDTNISAQKMPLIVLCPDRQKMSFKNAIKQKEDNEPVIYANKFMNKEDITTLETNTPIVFDKLQTQKTNIWNECLSFLGINNANTEKKERLITTEVDSNNQFIKSNEDVALKSRQFACKLINEMFGLNISVERRTNLKIEITEFEDIDGEEEQE